MININQHNYEEFFLLYADGELSAADRQAVEQFAQENPLLAEELGILLQTKLSVDDESFYTNKASLYRTEASGGINLTNAEEYFLLYTDQELTATEKEEVERFVLQHPGLQESFTQIRQTVLLSETIAFPDKESLYKKEERRIFYLRWQQIAVAAAFIGAILLTWQILPESKTAGQPTALLKQEIRKKDPSELLKTDTQSSLPVQKDQSKQITKEATNYTASVAVQPVNTISNTATAPNTVINKATALLSDNSRTVTADNQRERADIIGHTAEADKNLHTENAAVNNTSISTAELAKPAAITNETDNNTHLTQQTVYKELETDDEKKSLYLGNLEINKDKLRGFFRKAGNLFRSKAKQQEEDKTEPVSSNTRSLK